MELAIINGTYRDSNTKVAAATGIDSNIYLPLFQNKISLILFNIKHFFYSYIYTYVHTIYAIIVRIVHYSKDISDDTSREK